MPFSQPLTISSPGTAPSAKVPAQGEPCPILCRQKHQPVLLVTSHTEGIPVMLYTGRAEGQMGMQMRNCGHLGLQAP